MTGKDTASVEPVRNLVTGGILRISSMNDILNVPLQSLVVTTK